MRSKPLGTLKACCAVAILVACTSGGPVPAGSIRPPRPDGSTSQPPGPDDPRNTFQTEETPAYPARVEEARRGATLDASVREESPEIIDASKHVDSSSKPLDACSGECDAGSPPAEPDGSADAEPGIDATDAT